MFVRVYFKRGDDQGTAKAEMTHKAIAALLEPRGVSIRQETAQQIRSIHMAQVGTERVYDPLIVELEPEDEVELKEVEFISTAVRQHSEEAMRNKNSVLVLIVSK